MVLIIIIKLVLLFTNHLLVYIIGWSFLSRYAIVRYEMVNILAEFVENCDSLYYVCGATTHSYVLKYKHDELKVYLFVQHNE